MSDHSFRLSRHNQRKRINAIALTPEDSKFGSCENNNDAHKLADLFKAHRAEIEKALQ